MKEMEELVLVEYIGNGQEIINPLGGKFRKIDGPKGLDKNKATELVSAYPGFRIVEQEELPTKGGKKKKWIE